MTLFLIIITALAGAFAFLSHGRAEDPAFTVKTLITTVAWPGATAQEMQDLVAEPLEKRLQELRYYDRVETIARPDVAFLTLTLKDDTPPAARAKRSSTKLARSLAMRRATCRVARSAPSSTTSSPTSCSASMR